jgi:glycosyltransferase involved in cell wall biosynthesis
MITDERFDDSYGLPRNRPHFKVVIFHCATFVGGGERHTADLAITLSGKHDVTVVDCGEPIYQQLLQGKSTITVQHCPAINLESDAVAIAASLQAFPADLAIMVTGAFRGLSLLLEAAISLLYTKSVRIDHGLLHSVPTYTSRLWCGFLPGLNIGTYRKRLLLLLRGHFPSHTITVSKTAKDHLCKNAYLRTPSVSVVHNGTPRRNAVALDKGLLRSEVLKLRPDQDVFVYCGRLSQEKAPHIAIEAIAKCIAVTNRSAVLIMIGCGPEENSLRELVTSLKLEEHVLFLGFHESPQIFLDCADALVLPSLTENFPIALLEGLKAGCFPIVSDVGGVSECFQFDTKIPHILCTPGSVESFANAMIRFLTQYSSKMAEIQVGYMSYVSEHFDRDMQISRMINILEMLGR